MDVRTILVPTDFSPHADRAIDAAVELAQKFDAKVHLLHAYHVDVPLTHPMGGVAVPENFFEGLREAANARLAELEQKVSARGVKVSAEARSSPASMAIEEVATDLPADLIVMGTRGRTGLKHVVLGSVAERTVRHAPCPVLTLKAG